MAALEDPYPSVLNSVVHALIAVAGGGDSLAPTNLVTACWRCNRRKGDLTLAELGRTLCEPVDSVWHGLADRYDALWRTAGRPDLKHDRGWLIAAQAVYAA